MLDIGWTELMVIGVITLIVVGPKDLPKVLRWAGYWMGKARSMAREFQKALDQYAKEAELDGVKKAVETPMRARSALRNAVDPTGALKKDLTDTEGEIRKGLSEVKTSATPVKSNGKAAPVQPVKAAEPAGAKTGEAAPDAANDERKVQAGGRS